MSQKGKFESFAIEFGKENKQNTKYGNVYNIEKKRGESNQNGNFQDYLRQKVKIKLFLSESIVI